MVSATKHIMTSAILLVLFAIIGTVIVSGLHEVTASKIQENKEAVLLRQLGQLLPADRYNNDILLDVKTVNEPQLNPRDEVIVYLARQDSQPVAAVFDVYAPKGYNGPIELLVAVNWDETLAGVRVVEHRETPGLGDGIEIERSNWITQFDGKSLTNPEEANWKVKRDGGQFDQMTGATITPRAVVKAIKQALLYFAAHKQELFDEQPLSDKQNQ